MIIYLDCNLRAKRAIKSPNAAPHHARTDGNKRQARTECRWGSQIKPAILYELFSYAQSEDGGQQARKKLIVNELQTPCSFSFKSEDHSMQDNCLDAKDAYIKYSSQEGAVK